MAPASPWLQWTSSSFTAANRPTFSTSAAVTEEQVTEAFKILIADKHVKAILVNIFGGIMKVDILAQGIINAAKSTRLSVPLIVRLEGTNVEKGKQLLKESGVALIAADDLADAAQKAVAAAKGK